MQLDDEDEYSAEANKQQEISLFPDHEELMITRVEQGQGRKRGRYIIHFTVFTVCIRRCNDQVQYVQRNVIRQKRTGRYCSGR